jgi:hypothetical protein
MLRNTIELERLVKLADEIGNYSSVRVQEICRKNLKHACDLFGYSFQYWEETGRFVKYADLETAKVAVSESVETVSESEDTETIKTANTRLTRQLLNETEGEKTCEFCLKRFRSARKEKRFCCDKCKNGYNNAKRREV